MCMTREEALQLAARAWCKPTTEHLTMIPELAEVFADMLLQANAKAESWMRDARQQCQNTDYYRGLVQEIGKMFGDKAYVSDDGSKQDSVLCAKVPQLVRAALGCSCKL